MLRDKKQHEHCDVIKAEKLLSSETTSVSSAETSSTKKEKASSSKKEKASSETSSTKKEKASSSKKTTKDYEVTMEVDDEVEFITNTDEVEVVTNNDEVEGITNWLLLILKHLFDEKNTIIRTINSEIVDHQNLHLLFYQDSESISKVHSSRVTVQQHI